MDLLLSLKGDHDSERNLTVANWLFSWTTHVVRSKSNFAWR